jgi:hypothetical protein
MQGPSAYGDQNSEYEAIMSSKALTGIFGTHLRQVGSFGRFVFGTVSGDLDFIEAGADSDFGFKIRLGRLAALAHATATAKPTLRRLHSQIPCGEGEDSLSPSAWAAGQLDIQTKKARDD